jgi:SpoVK/Ycf46/Vps4 family AAA+-type ATPase
MITMTTQTDNDREAQERIALCREKHENYLDLSNLGLSQIPDEIKGLKNIQSLNLSENSLTELPAFIGSCDTLEYLDLSYNRITALPGAIGDLASLETLNVRGNELSSLPRAIGKLASLTSLDISHNRLTRLPETMNNLSRLEQCKFLGNSIQILPEKIGILAKPKSLSVFAHMEKIIELTGKNGLSDVFFQTAKSHIEYISRKLNISPVQAVLFSHIVAEYDDSPVRMNAIARSLNCNRIKLMQYAGDFKELENRKLIRLYKPPRSRWTLDRDTVMYRIPQELTEALIKNEEYRPVNQANLPIAQWFIALERLFEQRVGEHEISYDELSDEINALLDDNLQLAIVKNIRGYHLSDDAMIILLRFCHYYANMDQDEMNLQALAALYDHQSQFTAHKRELKNGGHILITGEFIENANSDGFSDRESFKLTDRAKRELLTELQIKASLTAKDLIRAETIQEKKLFYNEKEAEQINRLASLLNMDAFREIQKRLSESGMRTGFACLFSGPPGTGKTETVYQIARRTGRNIMMVDISRTKSMWFGESEKKIKEIFTRYRNCVEEVEPTPILLFNEADAVIGKRKDISSSAVAQTENAIQNIILQELENLKGILIATTNMTDNMDKAFERRFLYKVEFDKPDNAVRQSIWQSMIPALSDEDTRKLASRYDFSGGQIENISRKCTVELVLSGTEPSLEQLSAFCQDELLAKEQTRKIGFAV